MIKTKKKFVTHNVIPPIILIFFSVILFFTLPVFFNYNDIEKKIEKKFDSEFKLNLKILDKISQKTFPSPYLLIKKGNLNFIDNDQKTSKIEFKDLKIFTSHKNIYSRSSIYMKRLEIEDVNFKLKYQDIKNFRDHIYYRINKPIQIKNSKFFYLDKFNKTILISPIYKLDYFINTKNNSKELKIKGNIFDVNYESFWKRNYNNPNESFNEIKFKNPNITIKNNFKFENSSNFSGTSLINILNENINIKYVKSSDKIFITSPIENINQKIKILAAIELNPFYFDSEISFEDKNFKFIINNLFNYIMNLNNNSLGNLNGQLLLKFKNIDNEIINQGEIKIIIDEKNLEISKSIFEVNEVGEISSEFNYYEKEGELIFNSKNVFLINNTKNLARKFQINPKKTRGLKKIYFDLNKNIETGQISITNINFNEKNPEEENKKTYIIKNIQNLKSALKKILT